MKARWLSPRRRGVDLVPRAARGSRRGDRPSRRPSGRARRPGWTSPRTTARTSDRQRVRVVEEPARPGRSPPCRGRSRARPGSSAGRGRRRRRRPCRRSCSEARTGPARRSRAASPRAPPTWIVLTTKSAPWSASRRSRWAEIVGSAPSAAAVQRAIRSRRREALRVDVVEGDLGRPERGRRQDVAEQVPGELDAARADEDDPGHRSSAFDGRPSGRTDVRMSSLAGPSWRMQRRNEKHGHRSHRGA